MPSIILSILASVFTLCLVQHFWTRVFSSPRTPYPPGPKPWPIVGNLLDFPKDKAHIAYLNMGRKAQSDIVYLNVIGVSMVVLNSAEAVNDLFVGRGKLYSDRPALPMLSLSGFGFPFVFYPYGDKWRKHRAMFSQEMSPKNLETVLKPEFQGSLNKFLCGLLDTPQKFESHTQLLSGGFFLSSAYGISIEDPQDYYLNIVKEAAKMSMEIVIPGKYLVDTFPSLGYIPPWFPGAKFHRVAAHGRKLVKKMLEEPLAFAKRSMEKGTSSMASRLLQQMHDEGTWSTEQEEALKDVLGTLYAAGSDTMSATLMTMILVFALYPDILKKGQEAVDAVVSFDRLPNSEDEGNVPYVSALLMEVLRWKPVAPLGVPHFVKETDVYKGYCIPANSIVIGNIWAILHDPVTYGEDVDRFRPERFLNPDGTLNNSVPYPEAAFGFGRRICAGKAFAHSALWVTVASLLACFNFSKALDKNGEEIHRSAIRDDVLISELQPFECTIRPRSRVAEELIRATRLAVA